MDTDTRLPVYVKLLAPTVRRLDEIAAGLGVTRAAALDALIQSATPRPRALAAALPPDHRGARGGGRRRKSKPA